MSVQEMCTGEETLVPAGLRGYRTWGVDPDGALVSRLPYRWTFGVQEAMCLRVPYEAFYPTPPSPLCSQPSCFICRPHAPAEPEPHDAPNSQCECGFYGWYTPHDTRMTQGKVFGAVEVSGRVLLGTHGFRAARARVLGLAPSDYFVGTTEPLHRLRATATQTGVPVYSNVDELLAAFPPDDVNDLVQHTCGPACDPELGPMIYFSSGGPTWMPKSVLSPVPAPPPTAPGAGMQRLMDAVAASMTKPSVRDQALELRKLRGTGPARNPFVRRGRTS